MIIAGDFNMEPSKLMCALSPTIHATENLQGLPIVE